MAPDTRHRTESGKGRLTFLVPCVLCLVTSILLYLAFPPAGAWPLAWVAFVPLFFLLDQATTLRAAFGWAYLTGFLFFLAIANWVTGFVSSFFHPLLGTGLLVILSAYLGFFFALAFLFWQAVKTGYSPWLSVLLFSAGWVICEQLRSFTSFGYALLGHSQSPFLPVIQIADVTGSVGVSCLVALVNAAAFVVLKEIFQKRSLSAATWRVIVLAGLIVSLVLSYGFRPRLWSEQGAQVRIAVVQANIALADTWDERKKDSIINKHLALTREALSAEPDVIVWSETAFPPYLWEEPFIFERVKAFVREVERPLLFGAVTKRGEGYYNSAVWLNKAGEEQGAYDKRNLVMFGEYIPLRRQIPLIDQLSPVDDFAAGRGAVIFEPKSGISLSPLICVEDTVPGLSRDAVRQGANVLVNLTNDAWFADSPGAKLHLQSALFRAVENRVPLVRATNTGVSCWVDPLGRVRERVVSADGEELLIAGTASFDVVAGGRRTFYTKYGDLFTGICFVGILTMVFLPRIFRTRRKHDIGKKGSNHR